MLKNVNEKEKEVINNLIDLEGVNVVDIDSYIQKKGLLVDLHVHKGKNSIKIPKEIFGKSKEETEKFKKNIRSGVFTICPESMLQFSNIEQKLRASKKAKSIGLDGRYMLSEEYLEFKKEVEKAQKDFEEIKEKISQNWDISLQEFKIKLKSFVENLSIDNESKLLVLNDVLNKVPTKEKFLNNCYLETELAYFPTVEERIITDKNLSEETLSSVEKRTIKCLYEVISSILSEIFDSLNNVIKYYLKHGNIKPMHIEMLMKLKKKVENRNIFNNKEINEVVKEMNKIFESSDESEVEEICENINSYIYGFAKKIDIDVYLDLDNSPLSIEELEIMASTL